MMQAVGDGVVDSLGEVRDIVRASFDVKEYYPSDQHRWQAEYERFKNLIVN